MFDFDADGALPAQQDADDQDMPPATANEGCGHGLCDCCERSPRAPRCRFGRECKKALNNVTASEKRKLKADPNNETLLAEKAHFDEVRKKGGAPLHAIILIYRSQTEQSQGSCRKRASTFDLSHELEELRLEQSTRNGVSLLYMTQTRWLQVAQEKHGKSASEAQDDWDKALKTTPLCKRRGQGKAMKLPMPDEEFIVGETKASHSKAMQLTSKGSKVKSGFDLNKAAMNIESGSFAMNDPFFKGSGSVLMDAASAANMSLAPDSKFGSSSALQQTLGTPEKGGADDEKKKKAYDLLAAKNRCRLKLREDLKKIREGLAKLSQESEALLVQRASSAEYACYAETLKQRLSLVCCASVEIADADLQSLSSVEAVLQRCLQMSKSQKLSQEVMDGISAVLGLIDCLHNWRPEEGSPTQQAGLADAVAKVGHSFKAT